MRAFSDGKFLHLFSDGTYSMSQSHWLSIASSVAYYELGFTYQNGGGHAESCVQCLQYWYSCWYSCLIEISMRCEHSEANQS